MFRNSNQIDNVPVVPPMHAFYAEASEANAILAACYSSVDDTDLFGLYIPQHDSSKVPEAVLKVLTDPRPRFHPNLGDVIGYGCDISLFVHYAAPHQVTGGYHDLRKYLKAYAAQFQNNIQFAARLYTLHPIIGCKHFFIMGNTRRFRCMDMMYWLSTYSLPAPFPLDLFGRLIAADAHVSRDDEIGVILSRYDDESKLIYANLFVHVLQMVVTTASFGRLEEHNTSKDCIEYMCKTQEESDLYMKVVEDALMMYCDDRWNTNDMPAQTGPSNETIYKWITFVSEHLKLALDSTLIFHQYEYNPDQWEFSSTNRMGKDDMFRMLYCVMQYVISKYLAVLYTHFHGWITVDDYAERFAPYALSLYLTLETKMADDRVKHKFGPGPMVYNADQLNVLTNNMRAHLVNDIQALLDGHPVPGIEVLISNRKMAYSHSTPVNAGLDDFREHTPPLVMDNDQMWALHSFGHFTGSPDDYPQRTQTIPLDGRHFREVFSQHFPLQSFVTSRLLRRENVGVPLTRLAVHGEYLFMPPEIHWGQGFLPSRPLSAQTMALAAEVLGPSDSRMLAMKFLHDRKKFDVENCRSFGCAIFPGDSELFEQVEGWIDEGYNPRDDPFWQVNLEELPPLEQQNEPEPEPEGETRELINYTAQIEDYENDIHDSDNEHELYDAEERVHDTNYPNPFLNNVAEIEEFYKEILSWLINPDDRDQPGHINSDPSKNAFWIRGMFANCGRHIMDQLSNAPSLDAYSKHMGAFLMFTVRANVMEALKAEQFRALKETPDEAMESLDDHEPMLELLQMEIDGVSATEDLLHVTAASTDENLNRRLLEECIRGLTLCVVQIERTPGSRICRIPPGCTRRSRNKSNLFFALIRRVAVFNYDHDEEIEENPQNVPIHQIGVRMSMNRSVLRKQGFALQEGHIIRFAPVCSIASEFRVLKAIPRLRTLPQSFRDRLFGNSIVPVRYGPLDVLSPPSNNLLTAAMATAPYPTTNVAIRNMIHNQVDPGCLQYLVRCLHHPDCRVDEPHFNALIQLVRTLGHAEPDTSGMCMVQGPPGTGKTNNIIYLLGAIIHHSEYGHAVPRSQQVTHQLTPADKDGRPVLRRSRNPASLKVLVVASTNAAVDNIVERLHYHGIPDGQGGTIYPSMLRIARFDYVAPVHIAQYLVRNAASPYEERERANPSLGAKRRKANECIIFLSTSSATGSSQLKELNQAFDIIIHDEAANSLESETLVPLTAACTREEVGHRRLFYFGVGDERQLPALSFIPNMLFGAKLLYEAPFDPSILQKSLFERLIYNGRVLHVALGSQYRMHPSISRITSPPYYNFYFNCPLPTNNFLVSYNQPHLTPNAFHPMTFLDTSQIRNRYETAGPAGAFDNSVEVDIVVQLVDTLFDIAGDDLNGEIAIIAPYRSQVELISAAIRIRCRNLRPQRIQVRRNVMVCTVDAMQGSQRNVVIFSTTRSNNRGNVGFVKEGRRLNVSLTRARYLNIVLGDYTTISTNQPPSTSGQHQHQQRARGIKTLEKVYDACSEHREPGARVAKAVINPAFHTDNTQPQFLINYQAIRNIPSTRSNVQGAQETQLLDATPSFTFASLFPQE